MRIRTITYGRRLSREFQSRELTLTADLEEGDSIVGTLAMMRNAVHEQLGVRECSQCAGNGLNQGVVCATCKGLGHT